MTFKMKQNVNKYDLSWHIYSEQNACSVLDFLGMVNPVQ